MTVAAHESLAEQAISLLRQGAARAVVPRATYRLQFHKDFTFNDAIAAVPYLKVLGISHVYASPILAARAGSMHGYDITDHNTINPELGGDARFEALSAELRRHDIGLILDFVPNHMGVGEANRWWRDVQQNGRCSRFAHYFDINWDPLKPELRNRVLLPILGKPYGECLEAGELKLDLRDGRFVIAYYEHTFPVTLNSVPLIFANHQLPPDLARRLAELPSHISTQPSDIERRQQLSPAIETDLRAWLLTPAGNAAATDAMRHINGTPGDPANFDRLHTLLEAQPYRLAYWRVSGEEINYRRFFDVNELVGLRQEFPDVFAATHKLLRKLLAKKQVDGVRIDHIDGLYNPLQYLIRLQMLDVAAETCGPTPCETISENGIENSIVEALSKTTYSSHTTPLYSLVEKILEPGEQLPDEWPVHGTSGYEFMNLLNGVFIETAHAKRFTQIYSRFTGLSTPVDELIYHSKKLILDVALSSELYVLQYMLSCLSAEDRYARDFTPKMLRDAIRETIACFPVYRTYIDERGQYTDRDRQFVEFAIRRAKRLNPGTSTSAFDYLRSVLLLEPKRYARSEGAAAEDYRRKLHFALKFQQLTGPVMAKGLEDTVCYVYNRFISVNEVGGSPEAFGVSLTDFHRANAKRATHWPNSMLGTSTHDTKRSEDVRARLNVLSEMPSAWSTRVLRWRRLNRAAKITLPDGRIVPDANEEYLLYQTLVGSCPLDLQNDRAAYISRIQQYMTKAVHEAKVNLSWINDDPEYVDALQRFIANILSPGAKKESAFVLDLLNFLPEIAFHGAINSLSQTLIKLTAPGVPDIYQGTELLDFSLVDPDNRRPVDFNLRSAALAHLNSAPGASMNDLQSGRPKLYFLCRALQLRESMPEFFRRAKYLSLRPHGDRAHNIIAFERSLDHDRVIVVVPRFTHTLMRARTQLPIEDVWGNTHITSPEGSLSGNWINELTGEHHTQLICRDLFRAVPFALLRHR